MKMYSIITNLLLRSRKNSIECISSKKIGSLFPLGARAGEGISRISVVRLGVRREAARDNPGSERNDDDLIRGKVTSDM